MLTASERIALEKFNKRIDKFTRSIKTKEQAEAFLQQIGVGETLTPEYKREG